MSSTVWCVARHKKEACLMIHLNVNKYFNMELSSGHGYFAPRCKCTLYLMCIFNIIENLKTFQTKIFYVHLNVQRLHEVISRKTDFVYGLCKMIKFGTKRNISAMHFIVFLHSPRTISVFSRTFAWARRIRRYTCIHFFYFLTFRNLFSK
jgi:hypothetical protein